jgi:hypothetical protein
MRGAGGRWLEALVASLHPTVIHIKEVGMASQQPSDGMSIGQLGHRPGLHVTVNLEGKTVGGAVLEAEQWVPGVVVGSGGDGTYVTIKLDTAIGGGERGGLFRRESRGQVLVQIDDPGRVRPLELADVQPGGVPDEILELARAGKKLEAVKRYRALNGATLDEARAFIASL